MTSDQSSLANQILFKLSRSKRGNAHTGKYMSIEEFEMLFPDSAVEEIRQ